MYFLIEYNAQKVIYKLISRTNGSITLKQYLWYNKSLPEVYITEDMENQNVLTVIKYKNMKANIKQISQEDIDTIKLESL